MAILIEAISVVVQLASIDNKYSGGWEQFQNDIPNQTLCADDMLARVGFMSPYDVESYIQHLEKNGLIYISNNEADDIVVIDQQKGPLIPCNWVDCDKFYLNDQQDMVVTRCRHITVKEDAGIFAPPGWKYDGSLSQTFGYVPSESLDKSLKYKGSDKGIDVYHNALTNQEAYIGRTNQNVNTTPDYESSQYAVAGPKSDIENLLNTMGILVNALISENNEKSHEAISVLLLQVIDIYGTDSLIYQQYFPVIDAIKNQIDAFNYSAALNQSQVFSRQLNEVKNIILSGEAEH